MTDVNINTLELFTTVIASTNYNTLYDTQSAYIKPAYSTSFAEYLIALKQKFGFRYLGATFETPIQTYDGIEYDISVGILIIVTLYGVCIVIELLHMLSYLITNSNTGSVPSTYDYMHAAYADDGECAESLVSLMRPTYRGEIYDEANNSNHIGLTSHRKETKPKKGVIYKSGWKISNN